MCVKDGVWRRCLLKMVCDKVVCERWCVTKMYVKDRVWQSCVWKMVCDEVVCERWCVTKMCDKDVCERWCVTKLMCDRWCVTKMCVKDEAAEAEADGTDTESKQEPHTKMGKTFLRSRKIVFSQCLAWPPQSPQPRPNPSPWQPAQRE